jgi:hypothetical protein
MEYFRILLICGLTMSLAVALGARGGESNSSSLVKILTDRTLWGKDFPTVLAYLQSWEQTGERKVAVFPSQVVGTTLYKTREDAQQAAMKLTRAMEAPQPRPKPEFAALLREVPPQQPIPLRLEVIPFFPDDGSVRVAWTGPSLQLFDPRLTLATVQSRLGPSERVTQEVVQTEKDERPVTLTQYHYAGGAVIFAESDLSLRPGSIDRVILDVPALAAALF